MSLANYRTPQKPLEECTQTYVNGLRSKLRSLFFAHKRGERWMSGKSIEAQIKHLEERLGVKAGEIPGPGRPKTDASRPIGYVYIIGNEQYGWYKIGYSLNPYERLIAFNVGCPVPLSIVAKFKCPKTLCTSLEADLHKTFSEQQLHNEWFNLTAEDLTRAKNLANLWILNRVPEGQLNQLLGLPKSFIGRETWHKKSISN